VRTSIIILALFIFSGTFAQQNKEADKLLQKVSQRYKKFKSVKADFSYVIDSKMEKSKEKQTGTIIVKGSKFRLDIANQAIICDNKTIWTYNKEVNEVQISKYNPKEGAIKLDEIFTMYDKGFLYKIAETKKDGAKDIVVFQLTPKDKKVNYHTIKLYVDKNNLEIIKTQVFDKSGTIHTYSISNQVPNVNFGDNVFDFDPAKYKGVEVVDLR